MGRSAAKRKGRSVGEDGTLEVNLDNLMAPPVDLQTPKWVSRAVQVAVAQFLLLIAAIILGLVQMEGNKYLRVRLKGCPIAVLQRDTPDSLFCCTGANTPVCLAANDSFTIMLSSALAWLLPLLPWAVGAGFALASHDGTHWPLLRRLGLYIFIFVNRTFLLYKVLGMLEKSMQSSESRSCWYAKYTYSRTCRENFDFSDHLVMLVLHYFVVCTVEAMAASVRFKKTRSIPILVVAAAVMLMAARSVYFTVLFFHTRLETIAALVLAIVFGESLVLYLMYLLYRWDDPRALAFLLGAPAESDTD
jgi:hypothetical protein